jgi:AsmA protein
MRRDTVMRRLRKLALALVACLSFAVLAPMYFAERRMDDSFAISGVSAAPRDLHVLTVPVRLSAAPDLTLLRAVVYDYGPAAPGSAGSHVVLDGPVFALNAAGPRPSAGAALEQPGGFDLEPMSPLIQQIAALGFDLITVRRGTVNVTTLGGDVETLSDVQVEVRKARKGQVAVLGSFTVRGQRLAFDATLSESADKKVPLRRPLQVSFKASLLQGAFEGHVDLSEDLQLTGQTELSISSLRRVGRWFGLPLYLSEGFNVTNLKGDLTWARQSLAFEKARISVDGNEGNGRLVLNLSGDRPMLEATLDFSSLNLTPYVEAARTQFFGFELPGASWSSFDISLPTIRYLDADLRISAHRVKLRDFAFGQGGATITAQAGKLHADITELELPSGTLSGQVTAIMTEPAPRYALRAKIENAELGTASARLWGASAVTGRATLTFDLTTTGYSLAEAARRLSGKAALTMPEGARVALDLRTVRAAAKAGARGWATLAKSHTTLDRLEARALIIDGVAFAEDMQARAGDVGLALAGRIGLVDGNMDARLTLKRNAPADQSLRPTDTGGETVSLRGPLSEPVLRGEDGDGAMVPREDRAP